VLFAGIDTSNYTTSVAIFNGLDKPPVSVGCVLEVNGGALGLRQSDALFSHVKNLPGVVNEAFSDFRGIIPQCVSASTKPTQAAGSYMPCFLAGEGLARSMASAYGVPFYGFSHQQGHITAAAYSAGCMDILEKEFLAWHVSGGTTELTLVRPSKDVFDATPVLETEDLAGGQLIDRAGVALGLKFPCGIELEKMLVPGKEYKGFAPKGFSISGIQNKVEALIKSGAPNDEIAGFAIASVLEVVRRATKNALKTHPGLPILCSGGVMSNRYIRTHLEAEFGAKFAEPQFSRDNAMGIAILGWIRTEMGK